MPGGTLVVRIIGDIREFEAQMGSLGARLRTFGQRAGQLGSSILRFTTPLLLAGGAAAKMSMGFEESMDKIVALVGVSRRQVNQWSEQIMNLAPTVASSPKELADALFFVTSAGLRGAKAMETLKVGARAAAAGLGDMPTVLDAVTSAMNSYAKSGLTAEQATDVMVAAVREGKMAAEDLAPVLGGVLPVASQLGVRFADVAAAIASATRQGLEASRAATGLRFLLTAFVKPSQQAQNALASVGLSAASLQRSLSERGLLATMQMLAERLDLTTAKGREAFATVVGGARGMSVASILVGQNAKAVEGVFHSVANAAGSTARAFSVAAEDAQFRWKSAMVSLEVAAIRVGDALAPIVAQIAHALSALAAALRHVDPGVVRALATALLSLTGVGVALKGLQALEGAFGSLISTGSSLLGILTSPVGALLLLAGAIVFVLARTGQLGRAWQWLRGVAQQAWAAIRPAVQEALDVVRTLIATFVAVTTELWRRYGDDIMRIVGAAFRIVVGVIAGALRIIVGVIKIVLAVIRGDWGAAWAGLRQIVAGVWEAIRAIVVGGLRLIAAILRGAASLLWDVASFVFGSLFRAARDAVGDMLGWLRSLPSRVVAALSALAGLLLELGRQAMASLWAGLRSAASGVLSWVGHLAKDIASKLNPANWFSTPEEHYRDLWGAAFRSIGREARRALPAVRGAVAAVASAAGPMPVPALAGGAAAGRPGGGAVVNIHIAGSVVAERDLARAVRDELVRLGRRNVRTGIL